MITSLSEPYWLTTDDALEIQREQIELRGGQAGIRDYGLLASAVARVQHLYYYDGESDLLTLAVRLGLAVAQNHPFLDGNKRTGAFMMIEFLAFNGAWLDMPNNTRLGRLFELAVSHRIEEGDLIEALGSYLVLAD